MKHILTFVFTFILFNLFSQAPIMNPISGSSVACSSPSSPLSFTASASNSPTSYSWSVASPTPGVVITNSASAVATISFPYSNATYTLYCVAINGFGPSATASFVVTVFETPSVSFSGSTSFCQGSSTNLSASSTIFAASPTIFYNWSPPAGLNTTNGPNVVASPSVPTTYTVTSTIGMCTGSAQITVFQMSSPTVFANATNTAGCYGYTTSLSGSGANTYAWSNGVFNNIPFTPNFSTIYNVTGYALNGCSSTATVALVVNQPPFMNIMSTSSILCVGQPALITINGNAASYWLNSVSTPTSFAVSPLTTTNYTIVGVSSMGCSSTQIFTQLVTTCVGIQTINGLSENTLKIYPNPNNGNFSIKSGVKETMQVINEVGQIVRLLEVDPETDCQVSGLKPGVYVILASTAKIKIIVTQ